MDLIYMHYECIFDILKKVIKKDNSGEVHYFEHESGHVAGVKFFSVDL